MPRCMRNNQLRMYIEFLRSGPTSNHVSFYSISLVKNQLRSARRKHFT